MIKKGDNVIVIAGSDKGKKGTVQMIVRATNRAVVEGINVKKKHEKPKTRDAKGAITEKPFSVNISNLQLVDPKSGTGTRVSYSISGDKKIRTAKKSGKEI